MPTNPFFNNGQTSLNGSVSEEQMLLDSLTIETIEINGVEMIYCPRTLVNEDKLFGEDTISAFTEAFPLEMIIDNVNEFGGQGDFISKFGLEVQDEADFVCSRKKFKLITNSEFPNEGDLLYFPLSSSLFEIKFVEHENPFYSLGKLTTFKVTCQLFSYSHEDFTSGVEDIDNLNVDLLNDDSVVNDAGADNDIIETEADEIIDFSETNPFGTF